MRGVVTGTRWRKVLRDLRERRGRALLAMIAMAAGTFAVSALLCKYEILHPVLNTMYSGTRPSSATLVTDSVDDALVASLRDVPGVGDAEARPLILARARAGDGQWIPALLYVIHDFDHQSLDWVQPNSGAWPPSAGEVLLERSAVRVAGLATGEPLVVQLPGSEQRSLRVAGTAYAAGLAPAWMEHVVYGFVAWNSVVREGASESAQIRIRVAEHALDEGHVREVADEARARLEDQGHAVTRVDVPIPGRHPHADQMDTFLYLLASFGLLAFLLSAVLVASMIHSLMAEQMRQVGIMKAIGATTHQIAGVYLAHVAVLAAGALVVGVPLGVVVGRAYAGFAAGILNADVTHAPFPWRAIAAVIVIGMLVPLLVALVPVLRASRIPVRVALAGGLDAAPFGARRLERWLSRLAWLPRPLVYSLRTTFLRPGRLALTVITLALGGAVFMAALNVSGAWNRSVDDDFARRRYDLSVRFAEAQPVETIAAALATAPAVEHAEFWAGASPYLIGANGAAGSPVALVGPDPGSALLDPRLREGRWLRADDTNAAVINQAVLLRNPTLRVGSDVQLRLEGRTIAFPVVGVIREMSPAPVVYATAGAVRAATGQTDERTRLARVVTREHTDAAQRAAADDLERLFAGIGIEVSGIQRMEDVRRGILDHLVIVMAILTMAAIIVVFVGALALASTLTINVLQRTREIGILGAIGAMPRVIASHVWIESLVIGLLSWLVAVAVAAPVSWALEAVTGRMFFKSPLDFYMSPAAAAAWLLLVVTLASIGSLYPALRAARLTVREAISHWEERS